MILRIRRVLRLLYCLQIVVEVACFTAAMVATNYLPPIAGTTTALSAASPSIASAAVPHIMSREEAQSILDETLMPKEEYSERIGWGRDAQGLGGENSQALSASDPRLTMTYAEFPLKSMDELIDLGIAYMPNRPRRKISLVDIGSGCGRLVLYAAMTRDTINSTPWDIHGIEISKLLHDRAVDYMNKGLATAILSPTDEAPSATEGQSSNTLSFHLGPAEDYRELLQSADIVFAYSTAFSAKSFSPELGALILDPEWSALLSQACSTGCVAITTDRALDPAYGWELVDRLEVENPEVFGTTGYLHVLR